MGIKFKIQYKPSKPDTLRNKQKVLFRGNTFKSGFEVVVEI